MVNQSWGKQATLTCTTISQILEVLLEFNEDLHLTPNLRYDLNVPGDPEPGLPDHLQAEETGMNPVISDEASARAILKQAKSDLTSGTLSSDRYHAIEKAVKQSQAFAPESQYTALSSKQLHTSEANNKPGVESEVAYDLGYLTPEHETEYYATTDARLGDESAAQQLSRLAPEKPNLAERERALSTKSPVSVYNWLKKNRPVHQQNVHDNDTVASEKSSAPKPSATSASSAPVRSSKRVSSGHQVKKHDEDILYDEDGNVIDVPPPPSKNKRKRDDDTGYRPKGGGSNRSRKKKTTDDGGSSNGKRASKK